MSFNLTYSYRGKSYVEAQNEYAKVYAEQSKTWFRISTITVSVLLSGYYLYDLYYYPTLIGQTSLYRFGGMVPSMLLACIFTFTPAYTNKHFFRDVLLLFLSLLLGVSIMLYSITTKGAHYGTFALYFATLYTLAPLPFLGSVIIGVLLAAGYVPVLYISSGANTIFDVDIWYAEFTLLASKCLILLYSLSNFIKFLYDFSLIISR